MMKNAGKLISGIVLTIGMMLMISMVSWAAGRVTLDVKNDVSNIMDGKLTERRTLGDKDMTYTIPSEWKKVETPLENIDAGYQYSLSDIPGQKKNDVEKLFVFYFDNGKYLNDLQDADDREGIEKAIVLNILPEEHMLDINVTGLTFPTKRIRPDGWELLHPDECYDYYDTRYKDKNGVTHNAEFVFLPDGRNGMCCALYIYTESVHKNEIIYLLKSI